MLPCSSHTVGALKVYNVKVEKIVTESIPASRAV